MSAIDYSKWDRMAAELSDDERSENAVDNYVSAITQMFDGMGVCVEHCNSHDNCSCTENLTDEDLEVVKLMNTPQLCSILARYDTFEVMSNDRRTVAKALVGLGTKVLQAKQTDNTRPQWLRIWPQIQLLIVESGPKGRFFHCFDSFVLTMTYSIWAGLLRDFSPPPSRLRSENTRSPFTAPAHFCSLAHIFSMAHTRYLGEMIEKKMSGCVYSKECLLTGSMVTVMHYALTRRVDAQTLCHKHKLDVHLAEVARHCLLALRLRHPEECMDRDTVILFDAVGPALLFLTAVSEKSQCGNLLSVDTLKILNQFVFPRVFGLFCDERSLCWKWEVFNDFFVSILSCLGVLINVKDLPIDILDEPILQASLRLFLVEHETGRMCRHVKSVLERAMIPVNTWKKRLLRDIPAEAFTSLKDSHGFDFGAALSKSSSSSPRFKKRGGPPAACSSSKVRNGNASLNSMKSSKSSKSQSQSSKLSTKIIKSRKVSGGVMVIEEADESVAWNGKTTSSTGTKPHMSKDSYNVVRSRAKRIEDEAAVEQFSRRVPRDSVERRSKRRRKISATATVVSKTRGGNGKQLSYAATAIQEAMGSMSFKEPFMKGDHLNVNRSMANVSNSQPHNLFDRLPNVCAFCGVTGFTLKKCSGCLALYYCTRDCQKFGWTAHKDACAENKKYLSAKNGTSDSSAESHSSTTNGVKHHPKSKSNRKCGR